jgi:DNA-binding NtrC family response regulator
MSSSLVSSPEGSVRFACPPLVGSSEPINRLRALTQAVASKDATVLIQGQSGTGKELVARTIHAQSRRVAGPFVAVDCTGLRDTLLESQLFGHVKGAFTGADQSTLGFVRSADGGTLFLDEIGEMDIKTQAKLLRCIQERSVVPLGSVRPVPVNVRFVAATHRDLRGMVARGEFREDLYFRLDVVRLPVPSLSERVVDIPELCEHFLQQIASLYGEDRVTLPPEVVEALCAYSWPGNVRELANAVEHMVVFSGAQRLDASALPERIRESLAAQAAARVAASQEAARAAELASGVASGPVSGVASGVASASKPGLIGQVIGEAVARSLDELMTLEAAEKTLIAKTLEATGGNQSRAAILLNIDRRRLYRKVRRYGLSHMVGARDE